MSKIDKSIEIVATVEKSFASMGPKSRTMIKETLERLYTNVRITQVAIIDDLDDIIERNPDLIFLVASKLSNSDDAEVVWLSQYFEERGIACTGSGSAAHNFERNKQLAKDKVSTMGYHTSRHIVVQQSDMQKVINHDLNYPLFVKPVDKGGGIGINEKSHVKNQLELEAKVLAITKEQNTAALVEEYLPGREFSVAILFDSSVDGYIAMPIELVAEANSIGVSMLSYHVKTNDQERVSEITDPTTFKQVCQSALGMFKAIEGRDYGRIDMRMDADGVPNFLEANLLPSLTQNYGSFPKSCLLNKGLSQSDMILAITELGLKRSGERLVVTSQV